MRCNLLILLGTHLIKLGDDVRVVGKEGIQIGCTRRNNERGYSQERKKCKHGCGSGQCHLQGVWQETNRKLIVENGMGGR